MAEDILKYFEKQIAGVTLIPSFGGRFEVTADGELIYSKLNEGRHAQAGEVIRNMTNFFIKGNTDET